ncbi:glutamine amidotransferase [Inhella inkyongensis]|uniref:Glutamine amidotransferase n=1 Tax=Inhella inkyongensis TaxID=392593 RepID=A0A840SBK3_9BURK|nr:class II glutamine amidotransferase [Inhella inkyongensis]MBB5205729.1 glutamine amidotransferase [Inhella inkyongensis]
MCRFLAYRGDSIYLEDLVCRPKHSLVRQSLRAEQSVLVTNGDGFGVGWYGDRDTPGLYRQVTPAWSDENLKALAAHVRSHLFFAHVRAATGGGISLANCHPFTAASFLFMHNGQVGGFGEVHRELEAQLPDTLWHQRRGGTDSELIFLLIVQQLVNGYGPVEATCAVLSDIWGRMKSAGVEAPLRFSAALADGDDVFAFRWASDQQPPTLYHHRAAYGQMVASEPLEGDPQGWDLLEPGQALCLHADGRSSAHALTIR